MIKRRFYRTERGEGDGASDSSSSSSSDSEVEAEATEETEAEDDKDAVAGVREYHESSSSGYESEDSSAKEVDAHSTGLLTNDDDIGAGHDGRNVAERHLSSKNEDEIVDMLSKSMGEKESVPADVGCILKCKSVFKCRLCPRIVCLTEETLKAHLQSKRHARSEKLLSQGRLKVMLNSDGEVEADGETHAERHARTVASATTQSSASAQRKNRGRQRQRERSKKRKKGKDLDKAGQSTKCPAKRRRKSES